MSGNRITSVKQPAKKQDSLQDRLESMYIEKEKTNKNAKQAYKFRTSNKKSIISNSKDSFDKRGIIVLMEPMYRLNLLSNFSYIENTSTDSTVILDKNDIKEVI